MRMLLHQLAQSGAAGGQVPGWDNVNGLWVPGDVVRTITSSDGSVTVDDTDPQNVDLTVVGGGGGSLTVQDENGNVATGVTQLDFQGAGVTASAGTGEVVVTIPGGGGSGGSIVVQEYAPATQTSIPGPTSTSFTDIDATHAAITVTTPSSGKVLITATGGFNAAVNNRTKINLREGSSNVPGTNRMLLNEVFSSGGPCQRTLTFSWQVTGLTPGSTHTYKLGWARATGTTTTDWIVDNGSGEWGTMLITAQGVG